MSWLVEHVAWLLSVKRRGKDGRTAFQRVRGREFAKRQVEFGERCLYKLQTKGPRHDEAGKLHERWRRGLFLGYAHSSNEYVYWDTSAVVKSRHLQRMRQPLRWPVGALEAVVGGKHGDYHRCVVPMLADEGQRPGPVQVENYRPGPLGIQIRKRDFEEHGATI